MALLKEKTLSSGESGNYWVVSSLTFSRSGMRLHLVLSLYKDAAHAAAGSTPLPCSNQFNLRITQPEIAGGNIVAVAYAKIMAEIALRIPSLDGETMVPKYPDLVGATVV
jgi:hypothetical protein